MPRFAEATALASIRQDQRAVSPVIGIILMVAITVVVAAVVFALAAGFGSDSGAKPRLTFTENERGGAAGGILTVVSIKNGPLPMNTLDLGGTSHEAISCQWSRLTGDLAVGDQVTCDAAGSLVITDSARQVLLFSGYFD